MGRILKVAFKAKCLARHTGRSITQNRHFEAVTSPHLKPVSHGVNKIGMGTGRERARDKQVNKYAIHTYSLTSKARERKDGGEIPGNRNIYRCSFSRFVAQFIEDNIWTPNHQRNHNPSKH